MATAALDASELRRAASVVSRVTVTPGPVHARSPTTAPRSPRSSRTSPRSSSFPPDVEIDVDVDEELFAPLTGHMSDVVDGKAELWISGAQLRGQPRARARSAPEQARLDLAVMLLRAKDRLSDDFADAPPDRELESRRARRLGRRTRSAGPSGSGSTVRRQRELYDFRLQHGFTDVADAAFERCWDADRR